MACKYPLVLSSIDGEYRIIELPEGDIICDAVGPTGPEGPEGPAGPAGTGGTAGNQGSTGPTGPCCTGPTGPGYMFESSVDKGWENAGGATNTEGEYLLGGSGPSGGQYLAYMPGLNSGAGGYMHVRSPFVRLDEGNSFNFGGDDFLRQQPDGTLGATATAVYFGITMGSTGAGNIQANTILEDGSYVATEDLDLTLVGADDAPVVGTPWTPGGGAYNLKANEFITDSRGRQYIDASNDFVLDIANGATGGAFHVSGATGTIYLDGTNGKVGIGTTAPGQLLDVVNDNTGAVAVRVESGSTASTGNDARFIAKVAGADGGDPHVRFMIQGGQSWCLGLANGASDNFRIADANNLDSGIALEIDTSQDVWMPQTLAVGQSAAADNAAVLELESTTQVFLPPRMTTTQRDLISPPAGGVIYNTTTNVLNFYNGSAWGAV